MTRPRTGLDYRPIALLDTDYKIYARLLLNRIRPSLPELVAETQYGFVPGRQVHDALDVFHALQKLVREGSTPSTALAISLDFAKAYDTLDRPFLLAVLQRVGCPHGFLQAVEQMHLATTAAYMTDADISEDHPVLNGIRQGCPPAPTLFVFAVDTLYQAVTAHPDIPGIQLPSGAEIGPAGFADDTNIYVRGPDAMKPLFQLLSNFEEASGLGVNRNKCFAIALHATKRPSVDLGLPLAGPSDTNRLLGGQVSSEPNNAKTWEITIQQMRTRMRSAELKTTNVLQRIKLTKAILVPKFTFIARHHWPNSDQIARVQRLAHNFVWSGTLAEDATRRAWMNSTVAALPTGDGGLGMPVLKQVLQELSVQVVARWATPNQGLRSEIGRIRLQHRKAPGGRTRVSRREPVKPILQNTITGTGLQMHHALQTQRREPDEIELTIAALQHVGKEATSTHHWQHGRLHVDYGARLEDLRPLRALQARRYGALHVAALMDAPIVGEDILLGHDGLALRPKEYAGLVSSTGTIGGLIGVEWISDTQLIFECKTRTYPLQDAQDRAFRRLCDVLVYNYPGILQNPGPANELIPTTPSHDIWYLAKCEGLYQLMWSPVNGIDVVVGTVATTQQATKAARHLTGNKDLQFHRHVWLDDVTSLWRTDSPTKVEDVRDLLRLKLTTTGLEEVEHRKERWGEWNQSIAAALDEVHWNDILQMPGAPAAHRLLLYRIKGGRITGWSPALQAVACPHCAELGAGGGRPDHIFWDCPNAQRLWAALQQRWTHLWTPTSRADLSGLLRNVFSLKLDVIPSKLWEHHEITRLFTITRHQSTVTHYLIPPAAYPRSDLVPKLKLRPGQLRSAWFPRPMASKTSLV